MRLAAGRSRSFGQLRKAWEVALFLAFFWFLFLAIVSTAQAFEAPQFLVIPAPQDIGRIGVIRISCFDEQGDEGIRYMQIDPPYTQLPDGRMAHIPAPGSWEAWVDGTWSCSASVGKDEQDTPVPSAPVEVIIDIPLSPPTLEVGDSGQGSAQFLAACSRTIAPHSSLFEHDQMLCWDRGEGMQGNPAPGPYSDRLALVRIVI